MRAGRGCELAGQSRLQELMEADDGKPRGKLQGEGG